MKVKILGIFLLACSYYSYGQTCKDYYPENVPDSRYTVNGDGTVLDKDTGLLWKQCVEGVSGANCATGIFVTYSWKAALELASATSFAGKTGWRVPSIKELANLGRFNCFSPSINEVVFPNTPVSYVWTSSPAISGTAPEAKSWVIGFNTISDTIIARNISLHVRLVHD